MHINVYIWYRLVVSEHHVSKALHDVYFGVSQSWLSHELEVRISIREAKYHLERLLSDRKDIAKQIKDLKEKIEDETDGPPIKKLAWLAENGDKTEVSFEVDKMNKEIATLEGEMVLRNAQISELQQKIVDADQGRYYFIIQIL